MLPCDRPPPLAPVGMPSLATWLRLLDTAALAPPQGLAAGLMLCISVNDLLPAAVEEVGFVQANACFYAGVLFFAAVVYLIPEPSPASIKVDAG